MNGLPPSWKQVKPKASPKLSIQLNVPTYGYAPGETITGRIHRQAKAVSPRAWISVTLMGRSIATISIERGSSNNSSTYHYNSDFYLLNGERHLLFDGPLHVPPDDPYGQSWQFAIPIPTHTSASIPAKQDPSYCFLPWNPAGYQIPQPLPFTFYTMEGTSSSRIRAWVEYYLHAELVEEHAGRAKVTATSIHPITIVPPRCIAAAPGPYIPAMHMQFPHRQFCTVASQRLLPGMEDAKLTLKQKVQKLFETSSVPQYSFFVFAQLPTHIQPNIQGPAVPLWLKIVRDTRNVHPMLEKTEKIVKLTKVDVRVWAGTGVTMKGWHIGKRDEYKASEIARVTVGSPKNVGYAASGERMRGLPVEVPSEGNERGAEGGVVPLDVGGLLGLRFGVNWLEILGEKKSMAANSGSNSGLCPSFVTYNIRRDYQMVVKMELELARETVKVVFEQGIVVVPG
ncbi:hypothetical protein MMYC01_210462 [Madurella mycetomatis]|uniref:Arrestin-like N-terminal domain-containing protein n=1 Tax=Madurella mycetomatis TaxID=100816 RepID=A0A175VNV7_9PEZI|nr:hypothetical protein MMYC01_210462 [Madurella mycetomatis]